VYRNKRKKSWGADLYTGFVNWCFQNIKKLLITNKLHTLYNEHTASPVHILFVVASHVIIAPGENK
jgi:hypothetical protein